MLAGPLPAQVDHQKLASQGANLEGTSPLTSFQRLVELLAADDGDVHLKLSFSRGDQGRSHVQGNLKTDLALICQNCLEQFVMNIQCDVEFDIVSDEGAASEVESETEIYVCQTSELDLSSLVEDELLLAVPMIPRHPDNDCEKTDYVVEDLIVDEPKEETYRPFADLAKQIEQQKDSEN